jgi:hypothetical protein
MGGDCAGGAIGGAASAIAAPLIRDQIYADSPALNYSDDKVRQAITVGLATLVGGAAGALLGTDATSAALAAQNESLNNATSGAKPVLVPMPVPGGAVAFMPLPGVAGPEGTSTPNNGPQKTDPLTNPLEAANDGNVITTPNNGPQGSTLTGTPASGPQGPTILSNPGCMLFPAICAGLTAIAQVLGDGAAGSTNNGGLTVGDRIGVLRDAATGKGNFALGEATAAEANALGKDWVGPGYRVSQTDGTTLISADGLRQYRPPAPKNSSYATTGVQANFQSRSVPSGGWQNNGHMNITGQ